MSSQPLQQLFDIETVGFEIVFQENKSLREKYTIEECKHIATGSYFAFKTYF